MSWIIKYLHQKNLPPPLYQKDCGSIQGCLCDLCVSLHRAPAWRWVFGLHAAPIWKETSFKSGIKNYMQSSKNLFLLILSNQSTPKYLVMPNHLILYPKKPVHEQWTSITQEYQHVMNNFLSTFWIDVLNTKNSQVK